MLNEGVERSKVGITAVAWYTLGRGKREASNSIG